MRGDEEEVVAWRLEGYIVYIYSLSFHFIQYVVSSMRSIKEYEVTSNRSIGAGMTVTGESSHKHLHLQRLLPISSSHYSRLNI